MHTPEHQQRSIHFVQYRNESNIARLSTARPRVVHTQRRIYCRNGLNQEALLCVRTMYTRCVGRKAAHNRATDPAYIAPIAAATAATRSVRCRAARRMPDGSARAADWHRGAGSCCRLWLSGWAAVSLALRAYQLALPKGSCCVLPEKPSPRGTN